MLGFLHLTKRNFFSYRQSLLMIAILSLTITSYGERPKPKPDETPLMVAKRLAQTKFKGFSYGHDLKKRQIDCVQFLSFVMEELIERKLTKIESDILCINYDFVDLKKAVAQGDPRTQGVFRAITESLKCGYQVSPQDVKPGDFIQYWYENSKGECLGHASIVSRVLRNDGGGVCVAIFGSHKSTNGIAETDFGGEGLSLTKPGRPVYIARFKRNTKNDK